MAVDVDEYARSGGRPAIFMEITDRDDLGSDLISPQEDQGGGNRYWLISEPQPGDTVLHYHRDAGGIVGISRVESGPVGDEIWWAARGTAARGKHLEPYLRAAWRVPLTGYTPLDPPLTPEEIGRKQQKVLAVKDRLQAEHGTGLQFPHYQYREGELRTLQAYMAIYPRDLLAVFPELAAQVADFEATAADELPRDTWEDPDEPTLYLANADIKVNRPDTAKLDPEAMTRANQNHNRLQNDLRQRVLDAGCPLLVTGNHVGFIDLAWTDPAGDHVTIAEVKSLTEANEEHQLRYGLGQLLDYLDGFDNDDYLGEVKTLRGVLFVQRAPRRLTWIRKCRTVDVELAWPGKWPRIP